jgi:hypothetical protein
VTLIDVPGIKDLAAQPNTQASDVRRQMHSVVLQEMPAVLPSHAHVYIWNDSVLLLSFLNGDSNIIQERIGKKMKKSWYVDRLLAEHLTIVAKAKKRSATLLPGNKTRDVYVYSGYLWDGAEA